MNRHAVLLLAASLLPVGAPTAAERWMLMARHGECHEIGSLKRKFEDLGAVADPQAFAAFVRTKGLEVRLVPMELPAGRAYEVSVPAKELSLVFVTAGLCAPPSGSMPR